MQQLPDALAALADYCQFILYKLVPSKKQPGKMDKLPVSPHTLEVFAKGANWQQDPAQWCSFAAASSMATALGSDYGVGFLFTDNDPFFVVDVDSCLDAEGQWSHFSQTVCGALPGAAIEVSQSGRGLHLFGTYTSMPDHACKDIPSGSEMYHTGRFIALTGAGAVGDASTDCTALLPAFIARFFPPRSAQAGRGWTSEPVEDYTSKLTDDELLARALETAPSTYRFDPTAVCFRDLWERNVERLAAKWPDDNAEFDQSSADLALAQHLAFWTGSNCDRMLSLMWRSALVRSKWESREQYVMDTVEKAANMQETWHSVVTAVDTTVVDEFGACKLRGSSPAQVQLAERVRAEAFANASPEAAAVLASQASAKFWLDNKNLTPEQMAEMVTPIAETHGPEFTTEPKRVTGYQYLSIDMQAEFFKGCIYVQDIHKIVTPEGRQLGEKQFNTVYGGYIFQMEDSGKSDSKKAWEAFTQSRAIRWPKADQTCFRPDLPPRQILEIDGLLQLNTYVPIQTKRVAGDPTVFLDHVVKLFPDARDRQIMLSYMAACVQHVGQKFQWAPLVQGVEGNGKSLLTRCVQYAVGERYTHMPRADEVDEKFNEWMFCNVFIGMEDVYYPESKRHIIETLKPMITNDRLPLRAMQAAQVMARTCANFIFNSNHRNALQKTRRDRRYAVFFTPQQTENDLLACGMTGDYFAKLYNWLRDEDGYAIVNEYLHTYDIAPEFNPALASGGLASRAPETSSTDEAIVEGRGAAEQAVLEAIEEGRAGFAGGWVSSIALGELLRIIRKDSAIPPQRRRELMQGLGYDYHPALSGGRVNNPTLVDNGKPRLYIRQGHLSAQLQTCAEITRAYESAQTSAETNEIARKFS